MLSRKFTSAGQLLAGILGLLPVLASPAASAQEPFIGEVRLFAATYCPQGWMEADGSQLSIWQYQTLYSLLGTRYGGDGRENFRLPDLRGRVAIGRGQSPGGYYYEQGATGGSETVTLSVQEMPAHSHGISATPEVGTSTSSVATGGEASGGVLSQPVQSAGQSTPHENRSPFLVLRYCVAIVGTYPMRP